MTRTTNARIAGVAYLLYIAVAFPSMVISNRASAGESLAAKLATITQHAGDLRVAAVLSLLGSFCALILAVTLYAITRDQDRDLAMLGLTCRVAEGVTGAASLSLTLALLTTITASGANAPDAGAAQTIAALIGNEPALIAATLFAVGSTIFSWLLFRGRMIPTSLAGLGVIGSALLVVVLPLQIAGVVVGGVLAQLIWIPVAIFELVVAVWFIVKGVRTPEVA